MKNKKHIVTGILAHVDAGKTTLSEAILYTAGNLRKIGRVDNGDAFLDTYELERSRGITIFSKQAEVSMNEMDLTLLDTPGHVDFSAEMERALQVLDYAVLVISGADGVQGHTLTLWSLLERYKIPTFLFINKMDQDGTQKDQLLKELQERLSSGCIDFGEKGSDEFYEMIAMEDEALLDHYLESGEITESKIREMIAERKIFPCFFGSALKLQGVNEFLSDFAFYTKEREYPEEFGARIFKITRDENGNRLTHLKVTGGNLKVKTVIIESDEKINQIRIYSGEKYETVNELQAGRICAVTGLSDTIPGQCLGAEQGGYEPVLEPVLTYQMILPEETSASVILPKLRQLEEEGGIEDEDLRNVRQQGAHDFGALGLRAVVQRGEHSQILDLVDGLVGHEGRLREDGATLHHTVADGDNASLRQVRAVLLEEAEHALQTLLVVVNRLFKLVLFAVVLVLVVAVDRLTDLLDEAGSEAFAGFEINQLVLDRAGAGIDDKDGFRHCGHPPL